MLRNRSIRSQPFLTKPALSHRAPERATAGGGIADAISAADTAQTDRSFQRSHPLQAL
jgi:hypothetical protein